MIDTLFINGQTGMASDTLNGTSLTAGVTVNREDDLLLYAVMTNGATPIELPADAAGELAVKQQKNPSSTAVLEISSWTKQLTPAGGYLLATNVSGSSLDAALGNAASMPFDAQISWTTGGKKTSTPVFLLTVVNNLNR
jgi:hypothetical protein